MMGVLRYLTRDMYEAFLAKNRFAVIHFDAEWDVGYRAAMRERMDEADRVFGQSIGFAEVDVDNSAYADLLRALPLLNVPCVTYYRNQQVIKAQIGATQDVIANIRTLLLTDL